MNMAGAEDNPISLRNFRAQMQTIDFMLARKPWLRVTLHAGEMTPQISGAAPGAVPEELTYHIAESVWNGHAERIGHGTALRYEKDRTELLRTMRERGVLVEICLTSEELIQGLKPDEIPFAAYRQAGVPTRKLMRKPASNTSSSSSNPAAASCDLNEIGTRGNAVNDYLPFLKETAEVRKSWFQPVRAADGWIIFTGR
jgi:hypothetical protein